MTPIAAKTVLVAHRQAAVRDRFAVALADARHRFVAADSEAAAIRAAGDPEAQPSLALVDLGLAADAAAFVRALRAAAAEVRAVFVFAGSVASAADLPPLADVPLLPEHAETARLAAQQITAKTSHRCLRADEEGPTTESPTADR